MRKNYTPGSDIHNKATEILRTWKNILESASTQVHDEGGVCTIDATEPKASGDSLSPTNKSGKKVELDLPSDQINPSAEENLECDLVCNVSLSAEKTGSVVPRNKERSYSSYLTGDGVRDKCFDMLLSALSVDTETESFINTEAIAKACGESPTDLRDKSKKSINYSPRDLELARDIEECLYNEFDGKTGPEYKGKFRSKYLNIKAVEAGAWLRKALREGSLNVDRFCEMGASEMASSERKEQDRILQERNLREAKAAQDNEAETDQFKCGRCHQRRTKYYQLQTRSADEPMTTYVTCVNCGNKWKFC